MNAQTFEISGNIVDVVNRRIFQGTLRVVDGKILEIREEQTEEVQYILPGFIDAHIHIESSMLIPSEFARIAVIHGTVGTVSDPHEIANVLGTDGVKFMIENGRKVPFKFNFGAPSCVPATAFETAGAHLGVSEIGDLLRMPEIKYLSEMMNFPGVLFKDPEVMGKIEQAKILHKPIDGHAPGLRGGDVATYIRAGITTDHECFTLDEAREKISLGMHVLIREGSAAKNFDALSPLIDEAPDWVMLCSDDKHPDDLADGHINQIAKKAIDLEYDTMNVLRACTLNPVRHYHLDIGLLQVDDPADFIIVDNLKDLNILSTWIDGVKVAENGMTLIERVGETEPNNFNIEIISIQDLKVQSTGTQIKVIEAIDGQLVTRKLECTPHIENSTIVGDTSRDILKLAVVNRYRKAPVAVGFIKGFGLTNGAIASSVAHDSHNIVAVGVDDASLTEAINIVIKSKGGISAVNGSTRMILPLPVAGIMTARDGFEIARSYHEIHCYAKQMGSRLTAPLMTLSFMALLVIPELKLSDKGLFDGNTFSFISLFEK